MAASAEQLEELLAPLESAPDRAAILTDVDGTIAPIVLDPSRARVPGETRELLARLARRYALVGCLSGRRALDARRMVGLDQLAYSGNHGFELLLPGESEIRADPSLDGREGEAADFVESLDPVELDRLGIRSEDKGPIVALHWRGAPDEDSAGARAREIAAAAEQRGLLPHDGRKVLEIRPRLEIDKGRAAATLLGTGEFRAALYGGDDRTDVDAFNRLRRLRDEGALEAAVCIAVTADESPPEVAEAADVTVDGPEGFTEVLRMLDRS